MATLPSYGELCCLPNPELAQVLLRTAKSTPDGEISSHLRTGVAIGALTPQVCSTWLDISSDPDTIVAYLHDPLSITVRKSAARAFAKVLRTPRADDLWSAAGGVPGLLNWFASASVDEIKHFCHCLGQLGTSQKNITKIRSWVTDLLKSLAWPYFQRPPHRTNDDRSLLVLYSRLLAACTSECAKEWLNNDGLPMPNNTRFLLAHYGLIQNKYLAEWPGASKTKSAAFLPHYLLAAIPAKSTTLTGMSASMEFSVKMLTAFIGQTSISWTSKDLKDSLVQPLLRRVWKRRFQISKQKVLEIVTMSTTCLTLHTKPDRTSWPTEETLNEYMCRLWALYPSDLTKTLSEYIAVGIDPRTEAAHKVLTIVPVPLRTQLLKIILKACYSLDIDGDTSITRHSGIEWREDVFFALPPRDAIAVLQRAVDLKLVRRFIQSTRHASLEYADCKGKSDYWSDLIRIRLSREQPHALLYAETYVRKLQQTAEKCRDPSERAKSVRRVIIFTVASGSLMLLHNVFTWLRRYNKDYRTLQQVYDRNLCQGDCLELLTGLSSGHSTVEVTAATLTADVKSANKIVMLLAESALLALKEPDFNWSVWKPVFEILPSLVQARSQRISRMRKTINLSDEEIYQAVWDDTLRTWVKLEELMLQDDNKPLNQNHASGPGSSADVPFSGQVDQMTLRFLNRLAQERDKLWIIHRRRTTPAVLDLEQLWPPGLPIQHLIPFNINEASTKSPAMPFMTDRTKRILFRAGHTVNSIDFPKDKAVNKTIGCFVDSYEYALKFWLAGEPKGESREARLREALNHAAKNFMLTGISEEMGKQFWSSQYLLYGFDLPKDIQECLLPPPISPLPTELPELTMEYNPQTTRVEPDAMWEGCLPTSVDAMLSIHRSITCGVGAACQHSRSQPERSRAFRPLFSFSAGSLARHSPAERDAYIATALLMIEGRQCAGNRLLSKPFPNAANPRFPAMFLDQVFLDDDTQQEYFALDILTRLRMSVPPALLARLVELLEAAKLNRTLKRSNAISDFTVLEVLIASDKPIAAGDFVSRFVLDRPEDSGWHRSILSRGLLNRLPHEELKAFLLGLIEDVAERLDEQCHRKQAESTSEKGQEQDGQALSTPRPYVKVTTVKLLANLFSNAPYISPVEALRVLADLFAKVTHIDMRLALLNSVIGILVTSDCDTKSEEAGQQMDRVLSAAVAHAASVNEQELYTEAQWRAAEETHCIPPMKSTSSASFYTSSPICAALLGAIQLLIDAGKEEKARHYVHKVIVPMIEKSCHYHQRWTKLFLRTHGLDVRVASSLPPMPVHPQMLTEIFRKHVNLVPIEMLPMLESYTAILIAPTASIKHISKMSSEDEAVKGAGGTHWQSTWSRGQYRLVNALDSELGNVSPGGITLQRLQEACVAQLSLLLAQGSDCTRELKRQLSALRPGTHANAKQHQLWVNQQKPVLVEILARIDAKRSEAWQQNPNRSPDVLPDVDEYNLWLAPYPTLPSEGTDEQKVKTFVHFIRESIDAILSSERPYHHRFSQVREAVLEVTPSRYDFAIALELGTLKELHASVQSSHTWLCIEIAERLLYNVSEQYRAGSLDGTTYDAHEINAAEAMVQRWQSSPIEGLRIMGRDAASRLKRCSEASSATKLASSLARPVSAVEFGGWESDSEV